MSDHLPTRLLTRQEVTQVREMIANHGEEESARRLGISAQTQTRALSGLPMEALTVQKIRGRLVDRARLEGGSL